VALAECSYEFSIAGDEWGLRQSRVFQQALISWDDALSDVPDTTKTKRAPLKVLKERTTTRRMTCVMFA